jgi:hypothetical protein
MDPSVAQPARARTSGSARAAVAAARAVSNEFVMPPSRLLDWEEAV